MVFRKIQKVCPRQILYIFADFLFFIKYSYKIQLNKLNVDKINDILVWHAHPNNVGEYTYTENKMPQYFKDLIPM